MTAEQVTLRLSPQLYHRLKAQAEQHQRSVAEEMLAVLAAAAQVDEPLADELAQTLAALPLLDDESLARAAITTFSGDAAERLEALHVQRQQRTLSPDEDQERALLLQRYEAQLLVRSEAMALLQARGHDVSRFRVKP
jgi:hypothetical protein